ncbi:T9SS type A sorting domain-containing protein [Arcticibacter svalbardensis]|uniref:T9SS type A sorting domain-containing protein n=1 Tax=Arcticibacter svalbardensis TaxID=1288027 RepID=UPI000A0420E8|nr:T9SS type A sorting domain-containing protein [Arcticibacter svalbardensis]
MIAGFFILEIDRYPEQFYFGVLPSWAVKNGYVYTRIFYHCTVTLDLENVTSSIIWNQNNILGINSLQPENNRIFNVYPNPVKDMVSIDLKTTESAEYKGINTVGQVVLSGTIYNGVNKINLSQFASGISTIRLSSKSIT